MSSCKSVQHVTSFLIVAGCFSDWFNSNVSNTIVAMTWLILNEHSFVIAWQDSPWSLCRLFVSVNWSLLGSSIRRQIHTWSLLDDTPVTGFFSGTNSPPHKTTEAKYLAYKFLDIQSARRCANHSNCVDESVNHRQALRESTQDIRPDIVDVDEHLVTAIHSNVVYSWPKRSTCPCFLTRLKVNGDILRQLWGLCFVIPCRRYRNVVRPQPWALDASHSTLFSRLRPCSLVCDPPSQEFWIHNLVLVSTAPDKRSWIRHRR